MSLKKRIEYLEQDIIASPIRIAAYSGFPFALFRYEPGEEWDLRKEMRLLKTRIEENGRKVTIWSISDLVWESLQKEKAVDDVINLEIERDFEVAQEQITTYLTDDDFTPIHQLISERLSKMNPDKDIVFIWRLGSLSPNVLRVNGLLERLHSSKAKLIPAIIFYPGVWDGSLNFMNLRSDYEPIGSYRVKIYGRESQ